MWNVEYDAGRRHAQCIEYRIESLRTQVVDAIERGGRGQQAQTLSAFREQSLDERGIEPIGREHRVGDALERVLIVIETRSTECEIEIDHHGIQPQGTRDS